MIKILKEGLHTSIQDLGRIGYRNYGIPVSGAMDIEAAKLSNLILGNEETDAVMEITLLGPKLQFYNDTQIAISGADFSPAKNGFPVEMNTCIEIQKDDIIEFGSRKYGVRTYLAILGGFRTEQMFGSRSFYVGITKKEKISSGDELLFKTKKTSGFAAEVQLNFNNSYFKKQTLMVDKGPEFDLLNDGQKQRLFAEVFTLGMNNRMAYQLKENLPNDLNPIISSTVLPGTVQLTPSGKLIILMRDCPTTGGYPRVLQLTEPSINRLAQKMQHEKVKFTF